MSNNNLKVAVRIRPLSQREINYKSIPVVAVTNKSVISITNLKVPLQNVGDSRERIRRFTFDYCFQPESSQSVIFDEIEPDIKNAIKNRFHSCVLAYGQSSSGKTHTMIGSTKDHGIIPRVCQNIFKYLKECLHSNETDKIETTISYLEIYNEKVRDLLSSINQISDDCKSSTTLKVREHPKKGPYVQGLSKHTASDPETIQKWFDIGKSNRSIAATLTNPYSSRSHSVFTLTFGEGIQLHLIDLAGSEKAGSKRISNLTFTEGANINKSLVALGNVISTLAERGTRTTRNQSKRFIPYRDSVLTWLLKDTLGGNSKTVLIATVSPSNTCYTETVNTLRFGQSAKKIVSCPVVNEDPKERLIRELRVEIEALKQQLAQHQEPRLLISSCTDHQLINKTNESFQQLNNSTEDNNSKNVNAKNLIGETSKINKLNLLRGDLTRFKGRNDRQSRHSINENFIPTMEVTSDVKKAKEVPTIRRTSSIGNNIMKPKSTKSYGSLETISNVSKEKAKRLSQPAVLRQNSLDKSRLLTKSALVSKSKGNLIKHQERGIVTEEKGPPMGDVKKSIAKPRSQIVAAVTSRLYGKVKKKEVGTETDVIPLIQEVPKELTICSNARLRLQELTRQALKAHRRKTTDTQTDLFPVLRVKEMSTDVDDLKISLVEIKDAQTETTEVQTRNVGVNCQIQNFEPVLQDGKNAFIITKSCGTQSSDSLPPETKTVVEQPAVSSISFKKYLQGNSKPEPTYTVINPCSSNPIYTSAVNFNVSHNYINHNRVTDTPSDDSLEDQNQANNLCFPDIISNHNSLELGTLNTETSAQKSMQEEKFASTNTIAEQFRTSNVLDEFCLNLGQATCLTSFQYADRLNSINVPVVHAPQVCLTKQFSEKCLPFYNTMPKCSNSNQSQTEFLNIADSYLPQILQPSTIQKCNAIKSVPLSKIPHCKNTKLPEMESDKMFRSMSKFMEEATNLMTNLTLAAEKLQTPQSYDLEVTVSGIDERLGISQVDKTCQDFTAQTFCGEETSTQTSPPLSLTSFKYPVNKYEEALKQSCRRLEDCIGKIQSSECPTCKVLNEEVNLEPPSQLPFQESTCSFESNYSLQSNIHSDYGSLRRKSKRCSRCTPSAYLKQLTYTRKQILDYSKSEL